MKSPVIFEFGQCVWAKSLTHIINLSKVKSRLSGGNGGHVFVYISMHPDTKKKNMVKPFAAGQPLQ